MVGEAAGESGRTIQRYTRLTKLIIELQKTVDAGTMGITPAEQISYLKPEEQAMLVMTMDYEQAFPSVSQAKRMREMSEAGTLTEDSMLAVMCEQKKPCWDNITLKGQALRKYFPQSYTPRQIEEIIYRLLGQWAEYQQKKAGYNITGPAYIADKVLFLCPLFFMTHKANATLYFEIEK